MRKNRPLNLIYLIFTAFMCLVFVTGIYSFITLPAKAKAEADEIEEMLRKQQEEADAKKAAMLEKEELHTIGDEIEAERPKAL